MSSQNNNNKQYMIHIKETRQMFAVMAPNLKEAKKMVFVQFGIKVDDWLDISELKGNLIVEMKHMGGGFQYQKIDQDRN